ncbi:MAG TPA: adenosylcobinamide-GDP ribazoletransferase [Burkholderiaceae bacterium]|nr:adenosylcobinamide-GDP ribazoletransferase [Burkholderiaceae bacterium]
MLQIRLLLVAVQFYSRLPVTGRLAQWLGHDPAQLAPATRYFPVVGLIVASLTAIVYAGCGLVLPHSVALMIAMAAGLMLTGAFHEDGLADYCDAMGGHHDKARLLEIMRDSRIGTYGAAALVMMLIGRFQTLAAIDPSWIGILLVTSASLSRGCAVAVMATLPYAHEGAAEGIAKPIARDLSRQDALVAIGLALAPAVLAAIWTGELPVFAAAGAAAFAMTAWMRRRIGRRLGGYTGDCLGAVQQLAELAFLIGALAILAMGIESGALEAPAADQID